MESSSVKIIDLLKDSKAKHLFSLEVSPGLDVQELCNLEQKPLFCSVTWHAKSHKCKDLEIPSIKLAEKLSKHHFNVQIHVSCDNLRRNYLESLLRKFKEINIRNIFAIQGDNFDSASSDFQYAKDLVSYIKETSGDYFCIGVAGYPDGDDRELQHLKTKVGYGADFIITQACFEARGYLDFENRCRNEGITVPIIPGIFLFESVNQLRGFAKLCKVRISGESVHHINDNNSDIEFLCKEVVRKIVNEISEGYICCHYFSLNRVKRVIDFIHDSGR